MLYLTEDGLQRLTQTDGIRSSSLTDDSLDEGGSLYMGFRWVNKHLHMSL